MGGPWKLDQLQAVDAIMAAVKDHVDYVIGEDEPKLPHSATATDVRRKEYRDDLRAEQRNRGGAY
jgi:hypothetical protein